MQITVLGAGRVGRAMIKDLAQEPAFDILVVDAQQQQLDALDSTAAAGTLATRCADLGEPHSITTLVQDSDLVVCAVPGHMGFETLKGVIAAGVDVVDISFSKEDPFLLDNLARDNDVTAVVDCGVAPGLHNIIAGYVASQLDNTHRLTCYVGGLPVVRTWPFEYKAVFSPGDVIEEYVRPSRYVEYGQEVEKPALSDVELLTFPGIGTLEAFNTDGLRTLLRTMDIPFMIEKTLRYPGHAELMRAFRDSGFFDPEPVDVGGQQVSPLALSARLLFDQWALAEGEEDMTVMKVIIEGARADRRYRYEYDLLDRYDRHTGTTSMARTTGYTATLVTRYLAEGHYTTKGIIPPEYLGRTPGCLEYMLAGYPQRGIILNETIQDLGPES